MTSPTTGAANNNVRVALSAPPSLRGRGFRRGGALVLTAAIAASATLLVACSGSPAAGAAQPGASQAATPGASVQRPAARVQSAVVTSTDLEARGKVIFEETAGGVGCQYCHGLDGKGKSEFASPDIRGKQPEDVIQAIATRPLMSIVKLTDAEVAAVVAYLAILP